MPDSSTYNIADSRPLGATAEVVTISLGTGVIGGSLMLTGNFTGTLTFTSDPGSGTFASQSLTSTSGTTGTTLVNAGQNISAGFLIPAGIVALKVTATSLTSGSCLVRWNYTAFNIPSDRDAKNSREARRATIVKEVTGYFAETSPRDNAVSASPCTAGVIHCTGIGLLAGDTVSNIVVLNNVAGVTLGLTKVGIYSKAGTLLASSADINASLLATGAKVLPLTAPFVAPTDDLYYIGILVVSAGTMIQPLRGHAAINAAGAIGTSSVKNVQQTGQTDLPATATLVASSASIAFWFGVS